MLKQSHAFSGFSVDNLKAARKFYGDTFGLSVEDAEGMLMLRLAGGTSVFIYEKPNHQPASFTVLNFPVKDVDAAVTWLEERGVKMEHYTGDLQTDKRGICRGHGHAIAWFQDPAGNILSVVQDEESA